MTTKLRYRVKARRGLNLVTGEPSNVVTLGNDTTLDIPDDRVLSGAMGQLRSCILIGEGETGALWFASSTSDVGRVLKHLEMGKLEILRVAGYLKDAPVGDMSA